MGNQVTAEYDCSPTTPMAIQTGISALALVDTDIWRLSNVDTLQV